MPSVPQPKTVLLNLKGRRSIGHRRRIIFLLEAFVSVLVHDPDRHIVPIVCGKVTVVIINYYHIFIRTQ